jgi:tRNA pseudouridine55 synthase
MGRGARKPEGFRDVDGILLLHKPVGISSNRALQKARHLFKANKAGHTGSLDPLASGMLPICFGEATKFSSYLLDAGKCYRAVCQLGKTTRTGDAEGEVISELPVQVSRAQIDSVLKQFTGTVEQVPPMYSAIKHRGQRLYHLARTGKEVERPARSIEIYSLELIDFSDDRLELDIHCSKGTYIRTLAEDIGKALGCGAFVAALERTGVHPYLQQPCHTLEQLGEMASLGIENLDSCLLPVNSALADLPELVIDTRAVDLLKQGRAVQVTHAPASVLLALVAESGQFIGVGKVLSDGKIAPKRLMNTAR